MKKLGSNKGLSLVEMLCVIVVLVFLSATLVVGIDLGSKTYTKSVSFAEAQVLCSTLSSAISDELRYSGEFTVDGDGNLLTFYSNTQGGDSSFTDDDGIIMLNDQKLIPSAAYNYGEKAEIVSLTYDLPTNVFNVVLKIKIGEDVLAESSFSVKKLNNTTPTV